MILIRTPLRISFFGGGTDYPESLPMLPDGGATLSTTIDKYTRLSVAPMAELFDFRYRVSYSRIELTSAVDEIEHPAVRECLRHMGIDHPLELHVINDLPARTGLGSSSSFTVSLLHALNALQGRHVGPGVLAREAVRVERERIHERVGLQDQYACAFGGFLHMRFHASGEVDVHPVPLRPERSQALQDRLLLVYTRIRRTAHEVLKNQMERTCTGQVTDELRQMASLVPVAMDILASERPLADFGELLHHTWQLKRRLSPEVSNPNLDELYRRARAAGAVGGKLLGAGGGGFLLFYVEPERRQEVVQALPELPAVDFRFSRGGSQVVFTG